MKFSEFATDIESEENGRWFELGEGASIRLRSFQSKVSQDVREALEAPYLALKRANKAIPSAEQETLLIKQMAKAIIVDWKGFMDDEDQEVAYSVKVAEEKLTSYREFRNLVARLVTDDDAYKVLAKEEAVKN
jgi:Na+/phosphate symporter